MAAGKRKKGRRHPGVVLIKPDPARRIGWRARYTDPDTGKTCKPTLPEPDARDIDTRAAWAGDKSDWIAQRRAELAAGAIPSTGSALDKTIEHYFTDNAHLDPDTLKKKRAVMRKLIAWATRVKITKADDLTQPALMSFRSVLLNEKKRKAKPGGKRGEYVNTGDKLSVRAINHNIGETVTVLRYLRKKRLLARVTYEDIEISLAKERPPRKKPDFMKPAACRKLLVSALEHDQETHAMTRAEARGDGAPGSTHVHDPIASYVLFMLLTGMRSEEGLACEWSWIDLEAPDENGQPVGEIVVPHLKRNSAGERQVRLDVSRTLRDLLSAMQPEPKLRKGSVFNLTEGEARAALERLQDGNEKTKRDPVDECWQSMRRTCSTYLVNAPSIFIAASAHLAAAQLGHSVQVAQKDYTGLVRISRDARTLEAAMQIDAEADRIVAEQQGRTGAWPANRPAKPGKLRVVGGAA